MKKNWVEVFISNFLISFLAASLILTGYLFPGTLQAAGSKELVVRSAGGAKTEAEKKAFFDPFTKETGIKVIPVEVGGDMWGKVAAQIKSKHVEWDLVSGYEYSSLMAAGEKGFLEKVDYKTIPKAKELIPGSVKEWGLAQEINVVCVGYNYKKFGDNYPKSWGDFFDVNKFPGPRAMNNFGAHTFNILAALLADGVSPDRLVPIDFERAFKKLDQIKPSVKLWYTSGDQLMQALMKEEVTLGAVFDGRAKVAKSLGAPVKLEFNQGLLLLCYWSVIKGAPNKDAAMEFLNFICRAENQAIWSNMIGYSSTNPKFIQYLSQDVQKDQAVHPENLSKLVPITANKDLEWLAKNYAMITERWNVWLSK